MFSFELDARGVTSFGTLLCAEIVSYMTSVVPGP